MYWEFKPDRGPACGLAFRRSSDQTAQIFKATYVGTGRLPDTPEFADMLTKDIALFKDADGRTTALLMFASQAGQMTPGNSYQIDYAIPEPHRSDREEAHDRAFSLLQHNPPVMGVFSSFTAIRLNSDTTGLQPFPVAPY